MYFIAFITSMIGIALAIFGYQLGRHPGIFSSPHRAAPIRFTETETTAIAAVVRFHGIIAIAAALLAASYQVAFG